MLGVRPSGDLTSSEDVDLLAKKDGSKEEKERVKPRRSISLAKLGELQKAREEAAAKRAQ